jgi:ActR/RegA family two-component response regulator
METENDARDTEVDNLRPRGAVAGLSQPTVATLHDVVCDHVRYALRACGQNKSKAAKALGIDRRTLYRMLERGERNSGGKP